MTISRSILNLEDFDGISLDRYYRSHSLNLADIIDIAIQIATTLQVLREQQIIHQDIKPANILIYPLTKQVRLINFSIASSLLRETPEIVQPQQLEGTLTHPSPAQTGLMNRGIDYRSDFYALGVTLYELLTNRLPFVADDPIDLIYFHLAQLAIPVEQVNPAIPTIVSQIVAKLMAKNTEDRYQSAMSLKDDLEQCRHQWQATGVIVGFELGKRDLLTDGDEQLAGTVGIAVDITDRKEVERKLKSTQFAVDNSADGIAWIRSDGSFAYGNKAICRMLGYSFAEFCTLYVWDIDDNEEIVSPRIWPELWNQLKEDQTSFFESEQHSKQGKRYPVEISINYFEFEGDEYSFLQVRDITNRRQAETALRNSEQRYQRLAGNIPGAIYQLQLTAGLGMTCPYISSGSYELLELSSAVVMANANCLLEIIHPDDILEFKKVVAESAQNMTPKFWEGRMVLRSGETKWIKCASRPERQLDGSIIWDGVMLDVTDRKQVEIALRQSEQRYQKLSDNIPGIIYQFRLAADGSITYPYISSGCWELLQLTPAAVMADSKCVIEKIHPDDILEFKKVVAESAQNMTPKLWEGRAILNSGDIKWIKSASRPERQPDGSIVWDGVMLDITKQQEALRDRQQAKTALQLTNNRLELSIQELQQATLLKDEFLANMSHELRTPLNAILGMSEILQEKLLGTINAHQINAISTIEQSGQHLLALITDILDVSKIAAGKLELQITTVSLAELCKSSLMLVKPQASEKQIQIETHLPTDLDQILVDERRMRQVLINLLNNAVKFTPEGGAVTLSIGCAAAPILPTTELDYILCFSVRDNGIGIASADLSKLFKPFMQIDSSLNRQYDGTGLGLVMVKQIVELHGGSVHIDSVVGEGSCFRVMLPQTYLQSNGGARDIAHNIDSTLPEILPPSPKSPLILLAEDNEININTLSSYLTAKGYRVILAQNGQEAIDLTHRYHPDLILMDIQMPEMNGLQAIERIRQDSPLTAIPIIVLTALAMEGDREKCLAMGADRYLVKPVKLQDLHRTIQGCLNTN